MEIDLLGAWFLMTVGVFLPYVVIKSSLRMRAGAPIPSRNRQLVTTIVMLGALVAIALYTANREGMDLFARGHAGPGAVLTAVALVVLALGTLPLRWKMSSDESNRRLIQTRPTELRHLAPWLVLSLAAGVSEEIVYRGVMFTLLYWMTGSWWGAVLVCVLSFAAAHATQGWARAAFVGFLAVGFHLLVRMTGSLFLAMTAHAVYDFCAGVMYIWLSKTLPATAEPAVETQPA